MRSSLVRTPLIAAATAGLILATLSGCSASESEATVLAETSTVTVIHPAVPAPTFVPRVEGVSSVGDVRVWNFGGATEDGEAVTMNWIMTTTAVNVPTEGLETRFATGVFTFASTGTDSDDGNGNSNANIVGDQLILEGVAYYPTAGSVIETATSTVRAIVGGTGRFAGARGSVVSTRLSGDTWRHEFTLD